jgi:hypothetical protein
MVPRTAGGADRPYGWDQPARRVVIRFGALVEITPIA